jgi:hypothetical protein
MKLGSEAHKELFCRSFIDSHVKFEPGELPWPALDSINLEKLRGIPFWYEALRTERNAGAMVNTFAEKISDPLLKEAITLQGMEEARHGQLIEFLINHYDLQVDQPPEPVLPNNIKTAFLDFGFGECLDSFLAFGMFEIARQANYLPQQFFEIFDLILNEEARHIMFFINWVTYSQINQGGNPTWLRGVYALWHYGRAFQDKIQAFTGSIDDKQEGFTATGASNFVDDLTPELFLSMSLQENARRMSAFDKQLLQPRLIPRLATITLRLVKITSRHHPNPTTQFSKP